MKRLPVLIIVSIIIVCAGFPAYSDNDGLSKIFEKVNPSVVVIRTVEVQPAPFTKEGFTSMEGQASGVLISDDGRIMTASHVVQTADKVVIEFLDGQEIPASVVASAPYADISLLQCETPPKDIKPAKIGDSDKTKVGDRVFIVGAPYGLRHTLTAGYVSGRHKSNNVVGTLSALELFQTDAAINSGNSGGPMFNLDGEVIGVVSYILTQSGGFEGIGFAVTSNLGVDLLINQKAFWTGIDSYFIAGPLAYVFNLPQPAGLLVQRVATGSPYARLGLRPGFMEMVMEGEQLIVGGDIILSVGGINVPDDITGFQQFSNYISSLKKGDDLTVKVLRGGKVELLSIKI